MAREKEQDQTVTVRVNSELLGMVDAWRETLAPIVPNRSDAIRYLIETGLAAVKGKKR